MTNLTTRRRYPDETGRDLETWAVAATTGEYAGDYTAFEMMQFWMAAADAYGDEYDQVGVRRCRRTALRIGKAA